jgi:hypothetical protein
VVSQIRARRNLLKGERINSALLDEKRKMFGFLNRFEITINVYLKKKYEEIKYETTLNSCEVPLIAL